MKNYHSIFQQPDGYNNDCYQLVSTENALSSISKPIEYICKKAEEYHYVNVDDKNTDIRVRFSKRQIKIIFMHDGLIKTLIKKNSFEEWGLQNFTFDSKDEAVKFYLEVEPTDNQRIKVIMLSLQRSYYSS